MLGIGFSYLMNEQVSHCYHIANPTIHAIGSGSTIKPIHAAETGQVHPLSREQIKAAVIPAGINAFHAFLKRNGANTEGCHRNSIAIRKGRPTCNNGMQKGRRLFPVR